MDIAFVLFFIFYFLNSKLDPSIIKILQNSRMCIFKWIFYKKNILLQYFLCFFDTKVKFHNRIFSSLNWVKMQCKPLFPSFFMYFSPPLSKFFFLLFYFIIVNIFLSYFFLWKMKSKKNSFMLKTGWVSHVRICWCWKNAIFYFITKMWPIMIFFFFVCKYEYFIVQPILIENWIQLS